MKKIQFKKEKRKKRKIFKILYQFTKDTAFYREGDLLLRISECIFHKRMVFYETCK